MLPVSSQRKHGSAEKRVPSRKVGKLCSSSSAKKNRGSQPAIELRVFSRRHARRSGTSWPPDFLKETSNARLVLTRLTLPARRTAWCTLCCLSRGRKGGSTWTAALCVERIASWKGTYGYRPTGMGSRGPERRGNSQGANPGWAWAGGQIP